MFVYCVSVHVLFIAALLLFQHLHGVELTKIIHPEDAPRVTEAIRNALLYNQVAQVCILNATTPKGWSSRNSLPILCPKRFGDDDCCLSE